MDFHVKCHLANNIQVAYCHCQLSPRVNGTQNKKIPKKVTSLFNEILKKNTLFFFFLFAFL